MSRYIKATGPEAEYEPGSGNRVLRNKLRIKSRSAMDEAEAIALEQVQKRYFFEEIVTDSTQFTADLIKQMHLDWLGDIYEWASSYRTVDISKEDFKFPPAYLIPDNMSAFERDFLEKLTPCHPRTIHAICEAVARVHAELLLIHPFREGNGRLARWLANIMFAQARMPLPDYGFVGKGSRKWRENYLEAVIKGYYQDYSDLVFFFETALERGYAADFSFKSERGEAPSKTEDS
jgi:cell filamentation protein